MATHPTTNVGRGIRLPRNEFRGKRTNPDQIGFGKRPMQETAPTAESYPIKWHKTMAQECGKIL